MALSAFTDRSHPPTDEDLHAVLGAAHVAWVRLIELVTERIPPISRVWGFTSTRTGWGLRLRHQGRVILYMTPSHDRFLVSFALGEKAVVAARAKNLPTWVLKVVDASPRYAEGRGVRFEIRNSREAAPLATLAELKNDP